MDNKGLVFGELTNGQYGLVLDPDNVFWAVIPKNNEKALLTRNLLSLYEKNKDGLDKELADFRFTADLTAVYIDPTDRCNASCPYCYIPEKIRRHGRSMTWKELEYILRKISRYFQGAKKKPVLIFHASEPLLVKDILFKAISSFSSHFFFGLQTNAMLLEEQDAEFLKKHKVGVGISLDSFAPAINNRLRVSAGERGNFAKAVRAIEFFQGYPGLNILTTVTRLNVEHLAEFVEFLHEKKVGCVLLNPIRMTQKGARALVPDEKMLTKNFIKAVECAVTLSKETKQQIIIGNFANIILGIIAPSARRLMCDISPCGGGRCFFTITASGEMIPCGEFIGLRGFSGGNIFRDSIAYAMRSLSFKRIRARIVEKISECDTCAFRNICGAPCPAELHGLGDMYPVRSKSLSAQTSNGMYRKAVFCDFYKEVIRYAFKLLAEKKEKYLLRKEGFKSLKFVYALS